MNLYACSRDRALPLPPPSPSLGEATSPQPVASSSGWTDGSVAQASGHAERGGGRWERDEAGGRGAAKRKARVYDVLKDKEDNEMRLTATNAERHEPAIRRALQMEGSI